MDQRRPGDLLRDEIYPQLDAAAAGLLTPYDPRAPGSGGAQYYTLACPACGAREAFYYPGSSTIQCNRRNQCGAVTTLWDALQERSGSMSNGEVLQTLADAAGVTLDRRGQQDSDPKTRKTVSLRREVERLLRSYLWSDPAAWSYLTETRGYTEAELEKLDWGYYPYWVTVQRDLEAAGVDPNDAIEQGVLPDLERQKKLGKRAWMMDQRITVIWPAPDGDFFLCGRRIDGESEKKYIYSPGANLSLPRQLHSGRKRLWGVEGFMDEGAMSLMGVRGMACGGNSINNAQAASIAEAEIPEVGFVTDAGNAGMDGGMRTVERCESLGVTTYIASIPEGADDPDAMRRNGNQDVFLELLDNARTGGDYAARLLLTGFAKRPGRRGEMLRRAQTLRAKLTLPSRADFDRIWEGYGVPITHTADDAVHLLSQLMLAGMDAGRAGERVEELTGHAVTVEAREGV